MLLCAEVQAVVERAELVASTVELERAELASGGEDRYRSATMGRERRQCKGGSMMPTACWTRCWAETIEQRWFR
jgi:hypothetical protein